MFIIMFNFHNKYDEDTSDDSDSKKIKKKKNLSAMPEIQI